MLTRLTRKLRFRAAVIAAAVYALCVVAPPLALALIDDGTIAAHCLTAVDHSEATAHVPGDDAIHQHPDDNAPTAGGGKAHTSHTRSCCGLFGFAAVSDDASHAVVQLILASYLVPTLQAGLFGQSPDRINRPPKAL